MSGDGAREMTTLETSRKADVSNEALQSDSTATAFSTFTTAIVSGNFSAAEEPLADDTLDAAGRCSGQDTSDEALPRYRKRSDLVQMRCL